MLSLIVEKAIEAYRDVSAPPRICSVYEGDNNLICGG